MSDPKDWFDDEVEGDAPEPVEVEVEHEAHEEVPAVRVGTGDDDFEVVYGCIRVEPGVHKKRSGVGGKYIIDERGDKRRIVR